MSDQADGDQREEAVRHSTEESSVREASRLSARLIYEVIRRDGEQELRRPLPSLIWSGFAAGMVISVSLLSQAILHRALPDTGYAAMIENVGYSFGFMIVIFGRMQLFTENTITTVLPVIARMTRWHVWSMIRLWSVVLASNVAGALLASAFLGLTDVLDAQMQATVETIAVHATQAGAGTSFVRAIPAGMLLAAIVWMMPSAINNGFWVILVFTWIIAAGGFAHIVVGSVELGYLLWRGVLDPVSALVDYFAPVLVGNVAGGTLIFALLAWGQVHREVESSTEESEEEHPA